MPRTRRASHGNMVSSAAELSKPISEFIVPPKELRKGSLSEHSPTQTNRYLIKSSNYLIAEGSGDHNMYYWEL